MRDKIVLACMLLRGGISASIALADVYSDETVGLAKCNQFRNGTCVQTQSL